MGSSVEVVQLKKPDKDNKQARRVNRKSPATKLRRLKCFVEVDKMVREGQYARTIARYIQGEAEEYLEVTEASLIGVVQRYKNGLESAGVKVGSEGKEFDDEIDPYVELRVLEEMFQTQKGRIVMEVQTEQNLRKLFSTTHREFEVLNAMGTNILKLKKALNLIGSNMKKTRGRMTIQAGRVDWARVVESPESRHKVLSFVEMMVDNPELMDDLVDAKKTIELPDAAQIIDITAELVEEVPMEEPPEKKKKKPGKKTRGEKIRAAKIRRMKKSRKSGKQ